MLLAATGPHAAAAESVNLRLVPATDALFVSDSAARARPDPSVIRPAQAQVAVVGRIDHPRLSLSDVSRVTVIGPDGNAVPLRVESRSLFIEFDRIVSMRLCFFARSEDVAAGRPFVLKWGTDVQAENVKAERLAFDAAQRERVREFRWRPEPSSPAAAANVTTIEVIADSSAEYHFLWYLLPMALIFVLLTIRKIQARDRTDSAAS